MRSALLSSDGRFTFAHPEGISRPDHALPGSFDALHALERFPDDGNPFGIPRLVHAPLSYTPARLIAYRTRVRTTLGTAGAALHFFLDDYRFETVWSRPHKAREALRAYRTLVCPDFSLYADWPLALQVWNVYRSRWCGALWASWGFEVIPVVSWSTAESYSFCFCGIPVHSLIALSTVGVRAADWILFERGYREMTSRLQPSRVLCYGSPASLGAALEALSDTCFYPTHWDARR
ncbi:MAG: DUF4417 domain-containing protein [Aggregatilineales bacterium]